MSPTRHSIAAISIADIPLLCARCPRGGPTSNYICHWPDDDATGTRYRPSKILVTN
jgi:hypothetical protein